MLFIQNTPLSFWIFVDYGTFGFSEILLNQNK